MTHWNVRFTMDEDNEWTGAKFDSKAERDAFTDMLDEKEVRYDVHALKGSKTDN